MASLFLTQSGLPRSDDGLGAVGYLEFAEDVEDMIGNAIEAEDQVVGDVAVVVALSDQVEDFALAVTLEVPWQP